MHYSCAGAAPVRACGLWACLYWSQSSADGGMRISPRCLATPLGGQNGQEHQDKVCRIFRRIGVRDNVHTIKI